MGSDVLIAVLGLLGVIVTLWVGYRVIVHAKISVDVFDRRERAGDVASPHGRADAEPAEAALRQIPSDPAPPQLAIPTNPSARRSPHPPVDPTGPEGPMPHFSPKGRYDDISTEEELEQALAASLLDGSWNNFRRTGPEEQS